MTRHTLAAALGLVLVLSLSGPSLVLGQEAPVNINTATLAQLEELPGVGPATAQAIIDARPFKSIDDLERVKGLGVARVATLRDRVTVATTPTPAATTPAPATPKPAMPKNEAPRAATPAPVGTIDINSATAAQLQELPGVGPAIAQDIIEARPFRSVDDLERVKGLGTARIEAIRGRVTVATASTSTPTTTKAAMPKEEAKTAAPAPTPTPAGAIDLNTATLAQLQELPGVGPATAQAIVEARPFKAVSDLENVRGLGPARFGAIRDLVTVSSATPTPTTAPAPSSPGPNSTAGAMKKQASPPTTAAKKSRATATLPEGTRINVNTATREELEGLPLIGPVKAQAIIDARPFKTIDSLKDVKGIGDVTMERIRPYVVIED
jgi:competence protein ComEA